MGRRLLPGLLLLFASASALAAPGEAAGEGTAADKKPYRWYVLPNVAFDTDDGLGFGARAELAFLEEGHDPHKLALVVHIFASLRGYHHHRFRLDRTGLGPDRNLRVTLHLAWRQWLNDGYWGVGNGATRERRYAGSFAADDPRRKRYRYTLYQPFAHLTLRGDISGPWSMFTAVNVKYSQVETYAGSLLEEQRPYGMEGGLGLILSAGLIYDTRAPEVNPESGVYAELSGRAAATLPDGAGAFAGLYANLRGYLAVTPWLVLCGRLMAEMLWGEVPFYEMVHWGGAWPRAGFGGFETLRGISFGRWRAPGKAILNLEARFRIADHSLLGAHVQWQVALFSDNGAVWGAGEAATAEDPEFPIHPAVGMGLRAVFQESFVGRIDTGVGLDPVRHGDGDIVNETSWGIYIVFDHAF